MKGKLKIILPLALVLGLGGFYKFAMAKPVPTKPPKIHGGIYVLGKEFLVNLDQGRFAKMTIALVLDHSDAALAPKKAEGGVKPPEGFGPMEQEAAVRDIITNDLTDAKDTELTQRLGREKLKKEILHDLRKGTDVKVKDVLFTDVTVQ